MTGQEYFHDNSAPLDFDLLSFWQWSASDLLSNTLRGRLAEFLVAQALGVATGVRAEWEPFDLQSSDGVKIEVKSAAYLQSWTQKRPSTIKFDIAPTHFWDSKTNTVDAELRRQADVYVFALLAHRDRSTIDPLDTSQWEFFVVPVSVLDARMPRQKSISLNVLLKLDLVRSNFGGLKRAIESVTGNKELNSAPDRR